MAARAMLTGFMVERVWAWYYSSAYMAGVFTLYLCIYLVSRVSTTASRPAATDDPLESSAALCTFRAMLRHSFCRPGSESCKSHRIYRRIASWKSPILG
jgi:hypothetical protein